QPGGSRVATRMMPSPRTPELTVQSSIRSDPMRPRRQRGAALIEFALVIPFLIVLTFTVVDLSRAFFVKNMLHQAAREGVRTLVVKTLADSASVRARVDQVLAAAGVTASAVNYLGPTNGQMGVRVASQFNWLYPGLFQWTGATFTNPTTLTAEAW